MRAWLKITVATLLPWLVMLSTNAATNVAPVVSGAPVSFTVDEDTTHTIAGMSVIDVDAGSGLLKVTLTAANGALTLAQTTGLDFTPPNGSGDGTADSSMVFFGTLANINAAISTLRYRGASNFAGLDTITFVVDDQGNTGDGGAKSETENINAIIAPINDIPTITAIADQRTPRNTDTNPIAFTIGDVETAAAALTVTGTSGTQSLVQDANILITAGAANCSVIVRPEANVSGTVLITITVGDGDDSLTETFNLVINDPPVLLIGPVGLTIDEDTATGAVAFTIGDTETAADSLTITSETTNSELVPLANIVLAGSGTNRTMTITPAANKSGTSTITLTVTDAAGDTATDTFILNVTPVNDSPVLTTATPAAMPAVVEDIAAAANVGFEVSVLSVQSCTDIESIALGVAVVDVDNTNGVWSYMIDGTNWVVFPAVTEVAAVVLTPTSKIRFQPNPDFDTGATLLYRAWDATNGAGNGTTVDTTVNGGDTAYSAAIGVALLPITRVNDAPLLDDTGTMSLDSVVEDVGSTTNVGTSVAAIILSAGGNRIVDVDTAALEGIAIIEMDVSNGRWEFSIDGGTSWSELGAGGTSARLLRSDARLRFVPSLNFNGSAFITLLAWDTTSGTNGSSVDPGALGGTSAFSINDETATITVSPVNDPPIAGTDTKSTNEGTPLVFAVADLFSNDSAGPTNDEIGDLYSIVSVTSTADTHGTVALLAGVITYTPEPNFSGTASFTYQIRDGGLPQLDASGTVNVTVAGVNDAPGLTVPVSLATQEETAASVAIAITDIDADTGEMQLTLAVTNGVVAFAPGAGLTVTAGTNGSASVALKGSLSALNAATLTYTPSADFVGSDTIAVSISDLGNSGSGGALSASTSIPVAVSAVNDAPTFTSGPTASPAIAGINQLVTFSVAASDIETDSLTFSWNFGDGPPGADGPSATHAYAAAGTFYATVTVQDTAGFSSAASVTVIVRAPTGGDGADTDGDGFSDSFELTVGTNPQDPLSTPFGGAAAGDSEPLLLSKLAIKLNFTKEGSDSISLSGTLPLPENYTFAGQQIVLDVGGVLEQFELDAKGKAGKKGTSLRLKLDKRFDVIRLDARMKGAYSSTLNAHGLIPADETNVTVPVRLYFNNTVLQISKTLPWLASDKSGTTK